MKMLIVLITITLNTYANDCEVEILEMRSEIAETQKFGKSISAFIGQIYDSIIVGRNWLDAQEGRTIGPRLGTQLFSGVDKIQKGSEEVRKGFNIQEDNLKHRFDRVLECLEQ